MVESQPSKLLVAGSIPVSRSIFWIVLRATVAQDAAGLVPSRRVIRISPGHNLAA